MIRVCRFCNNEIDDLGVSQRFAAHSSNCKLNFNRNETLRLKKLNKKISVHNVQCFNCGELFDRQFKSNQHNINNKYFCSAICRTNSKLIKTKCELCDKEYTKYGLAQHINSIHLNERKVRNKTDINYILNNKIRSEKISKARKEGFKSGKLVAKPLTDEVKKHLSIKSKEFNKEYWTDENRQKQSKRMLEVVKIHSGSYSSKNVCGRSKNVEYSGSMLNSTWEYKFINWCDTHDIKCTRNEIGFPYEWSGSRTYYPDFYLPENDTYVEIKGYERDRDRCKWKYFTGNLLIIRKDEIKAIESNSFELK